MHTAIYDEMFIGKLNNVPFICYIKKTIVNMKSLHFEIHPFKE